MPYLKEYIWEALEYGASTFEDVCAYVRTYAWSNYSDEDIFRSYNEIMSEISEGVEDEP